MDVVSLLEEAASSGLSLSVIGDRLNVKGPKTLASDAIVKQLAENKIAVLDVLTKRNNQPAIGDLTDYVGQDVDAGIWADLQAECVRRHGDAWQLHAELVSTGYHVTQLMARHIDRS